MARRSNLNILDQIARCQARHAVPLMVIIVYITMIFSRFNVVNLFRSMFADFSVPRRREWGHKADVGQWRPPWLSAHSQSIVTRMSIKILIMINFSSFKGTDLSCSMLANCFLPRCRDRGAMRPSSSAACYRRSLSPTVMVMWLSRQCSLASHRPPLLIPLLVYCCSPSAVIALVAVARPPPSSPSLLPPLPLPSLLHATLVGDAMDRATLAIFVNRHPHCCHHCPCHPRPLCHCHHHLPHALVVCCRPRWWSCGCLVNALLPATTRLCCSRCWLIVMTIQCFQTQGIHQWEGARGTHKRARQISFIIGWAVHSR
jgi:hypothetical protein